MTATVNGVVEATFTGLSSSGAISVPGLKAGDFVIGVYSVGDYFQPGLLFESIVSVDNELQQTSSTDFSARSFNIFLRRTS